MRTKPDMSVEDLGLLCDTTGPMIESFTVRSKEYRCRSCRCSVHIRVYDLEPSSKVAVREEATELYGIGMLGSC